jgi:hypothetical protein
VLGRVRPLVAGRISKAYGDEAPLRVGELHAE